MNSAPQMPAQNEEKEAGNELQTITEALRNKGLDPEKAMGALSEFKKTQVELSRVSYEYNKAAEALAEAMGGNVMEDQKAKFPQNLKMEDPDLRKYYRLSKKSTSGPEIPESQELPVELL